MDAQDLFGTPEPALVRALDTPFAWPRSGLEPLPWFPFTVAASREATVAAGRIARHTEHAYGYLRRVLGFTPRFRLLVLSREDWGRYAEVSAYGIAHMTADAHLVVGSEPADAWAEIAGELARRLPVAALRTLVRAHGTHPANPDAPDLTRLSESLVAHELARVVVDQSRARFPQPWLKDAFANYALVAVMAETDTDGLHRLGTLAEATRALAGITRAVDELGAPGVRLKPFEAVLIQLAITRAAYAAYADAQDAPLAAWFAHARRPSRDADFELGRMLARDVHPALAGLARTGSHADGRYARAA